MNRNHNQVELLNTLESIVESHLVLAISQLQNLSSEQLTSVPNLGDWNVAQCLDHLNKYGDFYIPQLQVAMKTVTEVPINYTTTKIGAFFIETVNPETGKRKYKALKEFCSSSDLDGYGAVQTFIQQLEQLIQIIRKAKNCTLLYPIKLSITKLFKLPAGDIIQFIVAHNQRHILQVERTLEVINRNN